MRYLIAHMIEGEAKRYHQKLSDEIAREFGLTPVRRRIEPHLTLKPPFETEADISGLKRMLAEFAAGQEAGPISLGSFGRFGERVVFMDVIPSSQAIRMIEDLLQLLAGLPYVKFDRFDRDKKLHATLALPKNAQQTAEIMRFCASHPMWFDTWLDNVALLARRPDRWEILEQYGLSS